MKLLKVRVEGFQSFEDSGEIEFSDGFNLIIGQNNGGKSALLRSLLVPLSDDRHRTPERWAAYELPAPISRLTIKVSGDEIRRAILRSEAQRIPFTQTIGANEFFARFWSAMN